MLKKYVSQQTLMPAGWLQNYLNTIQTPNTFENGYVMRYNLRILTRIFSAYNRQKNKDFQPRPEKQYSLEKRVQVQHVAESIVH